jgi:hypothetical protein
MSGPWSYPEELLAALVRLGLAPSASTAPLVVRDALNDLYRYELRRLRDRFVAGKLRKPEFLATVIALRKKYWPLTLQPDAWEKLVTPPAQAPTECQS